MNLRIAALTTKIAMSCGAAAIVLVAGSAANAATLNLSDMPLFITVSAKPNVMIMLDNSGSMKNVVPDTPYNPSTTYSCTGSVLGNTYRINIRITSSGTPYINQLYDTDGDGDTENVYYDWGRYGSGTGTSTTTGATSRSKRCFTPTSNYDARLYGDGGGSSETKFPDGYLPAVYTGNYLNWYFGTNAASSYAYGNTVSTFGSGARVKQNVKTRMLIAQTASNTLIDNMADNLRAGLSTYNDGEGGQLLEAIGDVNATKKTALKTAVNAMVASGNTPIAETLSDIGYYFSRGATDLTLYPSGAPAIRAMPATPAAPPMPAIPATPAVPAIPATTVARTDVFASDYTRHSSWDNGSNPVQYSCQKSFAVLMTDGQPQGDRGVSSRIADYTRDCERGLCNATANTDNLPTNGPLDAATYGNGSKAGWNYESQGSDYLDDLANALYNMDMRPDITKEPGVKNNVASYLITFADQQAIDDPLMQEAADRGGGEKFVAGNEAALLTAFQSALSGIVAKTAAASSASVNSGSVSSDARVYQARFNSGTWTGQLLSFPIDVTNGTLRAREWDAATRLPAHGSRAIITVNSSGAAIPFRWSNVSLDATRSTQLNSNATVAQNKLNYLRGDNSNEVWRGGLYRNRLGDDGVHNPFGDVIASSPIFVGRPPFRYRDNLEAAAYSAYRYTHRSRLGVVYVGANDGMLHAFNAATGVELFGFIPGKLFPKLTGAGASAKDLTNPAYSHAYFVDGAPNMGDVFYSSAWHTVLVGGYNKGGQGIYALDISDPTQFSEANATSIFRWEFTDAQDVDLGYTFSQPAIVRMANGKWAAVFGNGYNNTEADGRASTTGYAALYIVDIQNGALIKKIVAPAGSTTTPNGLATPAVVDLNGDSIVDYAFAGDLLGNLWKFDIRDSDTDKWKIANTDISNNPIPLFIATDSASPANRQPITVRPEIDVGPNGAGMMVLFGTGKYLENSDLFTTPQRTQSLYGIIDTNTGTSTDVVAARTDLTQQTIDYELQSTNDNTISRVRVTSDNPMDSNAKGWYLDLLSPVDGYQGERMVAYPVLRNNHQVVFTTLIPDGQPCGSGGESWLMEMPTWTGGRLQESAFDLNRDGKFNDADLVLLPDGSKVIANGLQWQKCKTCDDPDKSIYAEPGILVDSEKNVEYKYLSGTNGNVTVITENPGAGIYGRQSWRQRR